MTYFLKDISTILTGVNAKPDYNGEVAYLQGRHFTEAGALSNRLHPNLVLDSRITKHLLKDNDILFAAKGYKNFATLYKAEYGKAVASSTFFVIRLHEKFKNSFLPEYMIWFINHPESQQKLKAQALGTSLPSISMPVLKEFEIPCPPIAVQRAILNIYALREKEKAIKRRIDELKEYSIQRQLIIATNL